jgi:hypothetical protein
VPTHTSIQVIPPCPTCNHADRSNQSRSAIWLPASTITPLLSARSTLGSPDRRYLLCACSSERATSLTRESGTILPVRTYGFPMSSSGFS